MKVKNGRKEKKDNTEKVFEADQPDVAGRSENKKFKSSIQMTKVVNYWDNFSIKLQPKKKHRNTINFLGIGKLVSFLKKWKCYL